MNEQNQAGPVDFVIAWVDGSDPAWRARMAEWKRKAMSELDAEAGALDGGANGDCRYRDFGILRHWFRAVEECAPWVNRVFLVTDGQKPDWLDETNPKLRLVDHRDYIPGKWLPTFNAMPIELNLHRIPDLSERFVFFNDDIFLLRPVRPDFWFRRGLPRLPANLGYWRKAGFNNAARLGMNDYALLHRTLDVHALLWRNFPKWISPLRLGPLRAAANFVRLVVNGTLPVSAFGHLASPMLKSTLAEIWETCPRELSATSSRRFRADDQVNQWLVLAWQLAKGRFEPVADGPRRGISVSLCAANMPAVEAAVSGRRFPQICLNDNVGLEDPERCGAGLRRLFDSAFPKPSSFEKRAAAAGGSGDSR